MDPDPDAGSSGSGSGLRFLADLYYTLYRYWTDEFDLRICMCAGHYMYVFGGYEEIIERFGQDVYRLNLLTFTWELLVSTFYSNKLI